MNDISLSSILLMDTIQYIKMPVLVGPGQAIHPLQFTPQTRDRNTFTTSKLSLYQKPLTATLRLCVFLRLRFTAFATATAFLRSLCDFACSVPVRPIHAYGLRSVLPSFPGSRSSVVPTGCVRVFRGFLVPVRGCDQS